MNLWHKKMVAIGLVFLFVGILVGVTIGSYLTIKAVAKVGSSFLDEELVRQAVWQYKNNIAGCYPIKL